MSPKNLLLANGLTAIGLLGAASPGIADPAAPPAVAAPSPTMAVLLLTNGIVVQGLVSEDGTSYVVHTRLGKSHYPKSRVEASCRTIEEAYRYRAERVPDRDPDEHLKLARWCLTNRLNDPAKEQLRTVLALSPKHHEARAMLEKIGDTESRRAFRDPAVIQSRAEVATDRADPINPAVLGRAARELGISGLPQIAGLPPALAVKRADAFRRTAHVVLQKHCARCHNENYAGEFHLIPFRTRQDATPDAFRANLDAVLRLIDLQDPAKSELLASTLRAHGSGVSKRPIFSGSNDLSYQILAAWVNSLKAPRGAEGVAAARQQAPVPMADPAEGDRFATRRAPGTVPLPLTPIPNDGRPLPPAAPNPVAPLAPGSGTSMPPSAPPDGEFPAPYLLGGPKPNVASVTSGAPTAGAAGVGALPRAVGGLPPLPGGPAPTGAEEAPAEAPRKPPRKPVRFDPELLQRTLMNRFAPR